MRVVSLNTCLLPAVNRWIFRGLERLPHAQQNLINALEVQNSTQPIDVLHLQEGGKELPHAHADGHDHLLIYAHANAHFPRIVM